MHYSRKYLCHALYLSTHNNNAQEFRFLPPLYILASTRGIKLLRISVITRGFSLTTRLECSVFMANIAKQLSINDQFRPASLE